MLFASRRAGEKMSPRPQTPLSLGWIARLLVVAIALGSCGAKPSTLATAPVSAIAVLIRIADIEQGASETTEIVQAQFTLSARGSGAIWLTPNHSFICNGHSILAEVNGSLQTTDVYLPLHPVGGAYTCVYTDERGVSTTMRIGMPTGVFALTSPAPGSSLTIPHAPAMPATVGPTSGPTPIPTPGPTAIPTAGSIPPQRYPYLVSQPPVIVRYTYPQLPADASQASTSLDTIARGPINSGPGQRVIVEPSATLDGSALLTDYFTPTGYGFDGMGPGPGSVEAQAGYQWSLDSSLYNVRVEIEYQRTAPVTWVA